MAECQEELTRRYAKSVRAIYGVNQRNKLYHIGSCVLIEYEDSKYLITAAHVIDHLTDHKTTLYISGSEKLVALSGESVITTRTDIRRKKDKFDFSVLMLSEKTLSSLTGLYFIPKSEWLLRDVPEATNIGLVVGYPNSQNKRYYGARRSVKSTFFIYSSQFKKDIEIYETTGTHPTTHYLIDYSAKYSKNCYGVRVSSTHTKGVSGGALFTMPGFKNPDYYAVDRKCMGMLTGILIEKPDQQHVLIFTRLSEIIKAIPHIDKT